MSRKIAILLLVVFMGGLLFPFLTLAGQYESNKGTVIYEGLVPCGKTKASEGESSLVTEPCQLCHIFVMIDGIIDFITQKIVPPIVILMMIIAGIMFFFAGGNPTLLVQAKKLITSVVIGLVIIFSAFLIIQTILNVVGVLDTNPLHDWLKGNSFTVYCSIEYEEDVTSGGNGSSPSDYANDKDGCIGAGFYWYDETCHGEPKELSKSTSGGIEYVELECPSGEELVEDGQCESISMTGYVKSSVPYGNNGWRCEFGDIGGVPGTGTVTIKCTEEP